MAAAPTASATGRPAWQFVMALRLIAYRLEGPGGSHWPYVRHLPGVAGGVWDDSDGLNGHYMQASAVKWAVARCADCA